MKNEKKNIQGLNFVCSVDSVRLVYQSIFLSNIEKHECSYNARKVCSLSSFTIDR